MNEHTSRNLDELPYSDIHSMNITESSSFTKEELFNLLATLNKEQEELIELWLKKDTEDNKRTKGSLVLYLKEKLAETRRMLRFLE